MFYLQDDVVMGTLTVRENLLFSASLRLPKEFGKEDRKLRVEMILSDLGLSGVADSKVSINFRCRSKLNLCMTMSEKQLKCTKSLLL